MTDPTDATLRDLRAQVYGECTDLNWLAVKDNWRKPEALLWLSQRALCSLPERKPRKGNSG